MRWHNLTKTRKPCFVKDRLLAAVQHNLFEIVYRNVQRVGRHLECFWKPACKAHADEESYRGCDILLLPLNTWINVQETDYRVASSRWTEEVDSKTDLPAIATPLMSLPFCSFWKIAATSFGTSISFGNSTMALATFTLARQDEPCVLRPEVVTMAGRAFWQNSKDTCLGTAHTLFSHRSSSLRTLKTRVLERHIQFPEPETHVEDVASRGVYCTLASL